MKWTKGSVVWMRFALYAKSKNGSVGPEDYDVWRQNFGSMNADADGNGNGLVDAANYVVCARILPPVVVQA